MMRRFFFLAAVLMVAVLATAQTKKKIEVKLDSDNPEFKQSIYGYILYVKMHGESEEETEVDIDLESGGGNNGYGYIIVFPKQFTEKELKKQRVFSTGSSSAKINYAKTFSGSRDTEALGEGMGDGIKVFRPNGPRSTLTTVKVNNKENVRLPLYLAELKKNELIIFQFDDITLDIEVRQKPDEKYNALQKEYEELCKLVNDQWCCTNSKHKISKIVEEKTWVSTSEWKNLKDRRDNIIKEIEKVQNGFKLGETSIEKKQKYNDLLELFKNLDFDSHKGDCNSHPDPVYVSCDWCGTRYKSGSRCPNTGKNMKHHCGQTHKHGTNNCHPRPVCTCCGLTDENLSEKMLTLAKKVDNATNRRNAANEAKSQAQAWLNCSKKKCPLHPHGSKTSIIQRNYNRIAQYW